MDKNSARASEGVAVAVLVVAGIVGLLGYRSCMAMKMDPASARRLATITLPGGVSFQAQQDAFLYNLAHFLADTADTSVPKTFIFDELNFDSGATTLTAASGETVTRLTSVLAAYPAVNVLLVGYADSTGDLAANRALSLARAKTVAELLARNGVAPGRMGTDGKGEENPVASNETEEGRARNRRLELVVTKK